MKTIKFILFALITSICVVLTSCNSEDDVYNTESENELKVVGGGTVPTIIPVPEGYYEAYLDDFDYVYAWNYSTVGFEDNNLEWKFSVYPFKDRTVFINSQELFKFYFKNTENVIIDFNRCTLIATQFSSPYDLSDNSPKIEKHVVIFSNNNITMDIIVHPSEYPVTWGFTYPTVMVVIPKMTELRWASARIEQLGEVRYIFPE